MAEVTILAGLATFLAGFMLANLVVADNNAHAFAGHHPQPIEQKRLGKTRRSKPARHRGKQDIRIGLAFARRTGRNPISSKVRERYHAFAQALIKEQGGLPRPR